jgi:hypothetical protein
MTRMFQRRIGGAGVIPLMSADLDPTPANFPPPGGVPLPPPDPDDFQNTANRDNVLICPLWSDQGWPVHRIVVSYATDAVAPIALAAKLWVYDELTALWYYTGASFPATIPPNQLSFFDVVAPVNARVGNLTKNKATTGGCIQAMLVVAPGAGPNGTYTFAMAGDLTTLPI